MQVMVSSQDDIIMTLLTHEVGTVITLFTNEETEAQKG